jgi:hypothetical protein
LPDRLVEAADATVAEHVAPVAAAEGIEVSPASMSRAIAALPADGPGQTLTPGGRRRHRCGPRQGRLHPHGLARHLRGAGPVVC